jgi:hypothetical protein
VYLGEAGATTIRVLAACCSGDEECLVVSCSCRRYRALHVGSDGLSARSAGLWQKGEHLQLQCLEGMWD